MRRGGEKKEGKKGYGGKPQPRYYSLFHRHLRLIGRLRSFPLSSCLGGCCAVATPERQASTPGPQPKFPRRCSSAYGPIGCGTRATHQAEDAVPASTWGGPRCDLSADGTG